VRAFLRAYTYHDHRTPWRAVILAPGGAINPEWRDYDTLITGEQSVAGQGISRVNRED
jgi:hypothetical protein